MKVVILYGPPAAGKLTVAKELANQTGLKVMDNHQVLDLLSPFLPFKDEALSEVRTNLLRQIYRDILTAFSEAGVSFITTIGIARGDALGVLAEYHELVARSGGEACFVQLAPTEEVLLERVEAEERKNKINDKAYLQNWLQEHPNTYDILPNIEHLQIDNSNLSAAKVAAQIKQKYNL